MIEIGEPAPHMVVIGTAPVVSALKSQRDLPAGARVFCEADFLAALEVILAHAPPVIALDPEFAATARGAALVARVKADPRLSHSEIRALRRAGEPPSAAAMDEAPEVSSCEMLDLDRCGTRRAVRYRIRPQVETRVNGTVGQLVNLSVTGAQILGSLRVRPTETVRLLLTDDTTELRLRGVVAWASLEIGAGGASRYRVGLDLPDVDKQVLDTYCMRNRA